MCIPYKSAYIFICVYILTHIPTLLLFLPKVSLYVSVYLSIYLSVCLSIYLCVCPSFFLSLSIDPSIHLSIQPSMNPSIHLSIYPSIHLQREIVPMQWWWWGPALLHATSPLNVHVGDQAQLYLSNNARCFENSFLSLWVPREQIYRHYWDPYLSTCMWSKYPAEFKCVSKGVVETWEVNFADMTCPWPITV